MSVSKDVPDIACPGLACVVPCFNAGARIRPVLEKTVPMAAHVIVVDDGCTDGSIETLSDLPVEYVVFPSNRGKGHALLAGYRTALSNPSIQAICCLDADGQHDPAEIPKLFEAFRRTEASLLIGARVFDKAAVPWRSRFGNQVTAALTGWLLGHHLPDTQCGFRILSRQFTEDVLASVRGGRYETEMEIIIKALREGYRVETAPIATIYEEANRSSHFRKLQDSFRIYFRLIRCIVRRHTPRRGVV